MTEQNKMQWVKPSVTEVLAIDETETAPPGAGNSDGVTSYS